MTTGIRLRFAPSPNGRLHLGHALSALLNGEAARRLGGAFLVRIEDIDRERSTDAHIEAALADLSWLGLDWERPERRQSQHMDAYGKALRELRQRGLVYPCFASRGDVTAAIAGRDHPRDPDGSPLYPGLWKDASTTDVEARLEAGDKPAWRLDMAKALAVPGAGLLSWREIGPAGGHINADPALWGDVILARRDIATSYHLAVVVDDAAQGISHVVRGRDLYAATGLHRLLQHLLGLPQPTYLHHRLIIGPDGRKLSKSLASASLAELRAGDATLVDVKRLIGWDPDSDLDGLSADPQKPQPGAG